MYGLNKNIVVAYKSFFFKYLHSFYYVFKYKNVVSDISNFYSFFCFRSIHFCLNFNSYLKNFETK